MESFRLIILTFMGILFTFQLSWGRWGPPPGGDGDWVRFKYTVTVKDPANNPLNGVSLRMTSYYYLREQGEWNAHFVSESGSTNSSGTAELEKWVDVTGYYPEDYTFNYMTVEITDPEYTVLSSENTTSQYPVNSASFVVDHDVDGNGIIDDFEMQLAQKFCPSLIPHSPTHWISPEPVDIMSLTGSLNRHDIFAYLQDFAQIYYGSLLIDYIRPCAFEPGEILNQYGYHPSDPPLMGTNPNYSNWDRNQERYGPHIDFNKDGYFESWVPSGMYFMTFHFEYGDVNQNDTGTWDAEYENERINNYFENTIYVTLFTWENKFVLQYWFFYPYNDFVNNHEGDWEHINVIITSQNPDLAQIERIDFYFHKKVKIMYSGFETIDTHPLVYIGGYGNDLNWGSGQTSGGSYPKTGLWFDVGIFGVDEEVFGEGPWITYQELINNCIFTHRGIVILKNPDQYDFDQDPYFSWLKMNIYWGHLYHNSSPPSSYGIPPEGPFYNQDRNAWRQVGTADDSFEEYFDDPVE